jgi:peptide/nickel transport system substrate-binding protein
MKKPWSVLLSCVALLCLILAGCSSKEEKEAGPLKDELVLAIGAEPEGGFDPATGWGRYGSPLFQSTLLKRDSDLKIVNDLATGYGISPDGLTWTVKLRQDVKFSDGKPLTAEDVVFTYQTAASNGSSIDLTNMAKVESTDSHTVAFKLKKPQSTFLSMLVATGIVPKHLYGSDYGAKPVGSGPFKLVQWDKGQQVIAEVNPDYYGAKPHFKKLTFLFLNEDAAFASAKSGKVDVAYIPSAFSKQAVSGMKLLDVKSVDNRGITFPYIKAGGKDKNGYAIGNDVTSDIAIRKAVNTVVDRQKLVDGILEGYGTPAYTIADNLPWWNKDTVMKDGDVTKAKQILADAGWRDQNGDGIAEKGSLQASFTLIYPSGDLTRQSLALAVADMVKPAGILIQVEGKSWEETEKLMHSNAVMFGWGSHDPIEMYHVHSSAFQGVDYFNPGYYSSPAVDEWMNKALAAPDEETALEYWKKSQWDGQTGSSALGDAPWAWLVNIDHLYLAKDKLDTGKQRIQPHGHGWPLTDNIEEWKWKE